MKFSPEQCAQIRKDAVGKTVRDLTRHEDPHDGDYWTLTFDDGSETTFRFMSELVAATPALTALNAEDRAKGRPPLPAYATMSAGPTEHGVPETVMTFECRYSGVTLYLPSLFSEDPMSGEPLPTIHIDVPMGVPGIRVDGPHFKSLLVSEGQRLAVRVRWEYTLSKLPQKPGATP